MNTYQEEVISREKFESILDKTMFVLAGLALVTLVLEYGFYVNELVKSIIHLVDVLIIAYFIFYHYSKMIISRHPIRYIKSHWFEFILTTLILIQLVGVFYFSVLREVNISVIIRFYIVATQVYIVINIGIRTVRYSREVAQRSIHPTRVFVLSFLLLILTGTLLLMLPRATHNGISLIDALFTATSAVCVTGLIVVDTATYFTRFGQWIIMFLIQLGGLGIMTFTTFFAILLGGGMGIRERIFLSQLLNEANFSNLRKTLVSIILLTFTIEALGTFLLFNFWGDVFSSTRDRFFFSLFHSISAFCNAGFSTFSENLYAVRYNYGGVLTIAFLFITGGLGFIVLSDVLSKTTFSVFRAFKKEIPYERTRYLLHTKLTLRITLILILVGTFLFFVFEFNGVLKNESLIAKFIFSFFHSVTPRTAGFNVVDVSRLSVSTSLIVMFLMWVGASPGSTGGGVKTTSFGVLILKIYALVTGRDKVEVFGREISESTVARAFATATLSVLFIMGATLILSVTEKTASLIDLFFESVSAFSTVGLSRGVTPNLTNYGKLVIIILMFVGRVGPLAFLFAISKQKKPVKYEFPKENVLVT